MIFPDKSTIKSRRKRAGLTQKQLSREAGISQSLLAKLESGKTEASYDKVKRIFEVLDGLEKKEEKKAGEIMTKKIICAKPNDSVKDIVAKMKKNSISQLPVFSGTKQIGSVSETRIISLMEENKDIHKSLAKDIMDNPLPTISKEMSMSSLLPILKEAGAIIVLDKDKIVGIISKANVI